MKNIFKGVKIQQVFPYLLLIGGVLGLIASFVLTMETISVYKDPSHHLSCSINPVLACGPIMQSKEAEAFGFPNPLIGLVTFGAQIMLAVVMLAGAKIKRWFWRLYGLFFAGSLAFTLWLLWHSLYVIGAICIYCFVVWMVMIPTSWYLLQYLLAEKHISLRSKRLTKFIRQHHGDILFVFFIILFALILKRFWYYYGPLLGFN